MPAFLKERIASKAWFEFGFINRFVYVELAAFAIPYPLVRRTSTRPSVYCSVMPKGTSPLSPTNDSKRRAKEG